MKSSVLDDNDGDEREPWSQKKLHEIIHQNDQGSSEDLGCVCS